MIVSLPPGHTKKAFFTSLQVDPVVNMEILRLRQKLAEKDDQLNAYKVDIASTRFNPTSVSGQKLMHKCRELLEENRSLGRQINEGPIRDLLIAWGLEKGRNDDLQTKLNQRDGFVKLLDDENEKLQVALETLTLKLQKVSAFCADKKLDITKIMEADERLADGRVVSSGRAPGAGGSSSSSSSSSSAANAGASGSPNASYTGAPVVLAPTGSLEGDERRRSKKEDKKDKKDRGGERDRDRDRDRDRERRGRNNNE